MVRKINYPAMQKLDFYTSQCYHTSQDKEVCVRKDSDLFVFLFYRSRMSVTKTGSGGEKI